MDYTTLPLSAIQAAFEDVARDTPQTLGALTPAQLNWKPGPARWSVAQCLDHLLSANAQMRRQAELALGGAPRNVWQRLPFWPSIAGRLLVRSQTPQTTRKFVAPPPAQPSASDISSDVVERFAAQHRDLAGWVGSLDEPRAAVIMVSPFIKAIPYSVIDGCRLLVAHDHRHLQQARRVMQTDGFPKS